MDKISIRIPAAPEYLRIVRLVVSGLASRLDFTIEEIEDLKIAVDELCAYLTGSQGRSGTLEVGFEINDDRIAITGTGHFRPGDKVRTQLTEFSRMILDTVVDSASLEQTDGSPRFSLSKTRAAGVGRERS